jgi:peptidyl-prolyl cis-trans isomerase B (cyclophilin B)
MLRSLAVLFIVAAIALGACSSSSAADDPSTTTPTTVPLATVPTDYMGFVRQPTACGAAQPQLATDMKFDAPGDAAVGGVTTATMETSCGAIEIALDPSIAPETVNSFVFLAEAGFFDGTVSHRIIPGFMMQAGDPTATGLGGPGYRIPDELPTGDAPYQRGVVAMANAGPGSAGSQFFILFDEADWLPPSYTVFGEVVGGFDTLDAIAGLPLGTSATSADPTPSTPLETLFIESITIDR